MARPKADGAVFKLAKHKTTTRKSRAREPTRPAPLLQNQSARFANQLGRALASSLRPAALKIDQQVVHATLDCLRSVCVLILPKNWSQAIVKAMKLSRSEGADVDGFVVLKEGIDDRLRWTIVGATHV